MRFLSINLFGLAISLVSPFVYAIDFSRSMLVERYSLVGVIADKKGTEDKGVVLLYDKTQRKKLTLRKGDVLPGMPSYKIASIEKKQVTLKADYGNNVVLRAEAFQSGDNDRGSDMPVRSRGESDFLAENDHGGSFPQPTSVPPPMPGSPDSRLAGNAPYAPPPTSDIDYNSHGPRYAEMNSMPVPPPSPYDEFGSYNGGVDFYPHVDDIPPPPPLAPTYYEGDSPIFDD